MKKILLLSLAFSMIIAGSSVGYYYSIYLPRRDEQETLTKGFFKEEVKGAEDTSVETETTSQVEILPIPDAVITTPTTVHTEPIDMPEPAYNSNASSVYDEFKARQAEDCQRQNDKYSKCMEDFNEEMDRYLSCEEVNRDFQDNYTKEMENYQRCMDDYQNDLETYYTCLNHSSVCSKPSTMFCHKPMNPYSQYCQKPTNFCRKPNCY